jgi:molecular chaperone Hsp33
MIGNAMANKDILQRFIFDKAPIRGELIHLQESYRTIIHQHAYPAPLRQLLGEALCAAGLLSAIIKFSGRLSVQFRGKGKLKMLLAQCDNQFHMRGLAKWEGELSQEALMDSLSEGVLAIMLDSETKGGRYQGVVAWRGHSLAESLEGYFRDSEQLATKIWLSVDEKSAAGFLLQVVPAKDKVGSGIESEIIAPNWEWAIRQASRLESGDIRHLDYESLLRKLYPEEEIRIFPSESVAFQCACSRKRGEEAIAILGQKEAEAELKTNHTIVVTCDFCNKEYVFDRADVAKIFDKKDKPPSDIHLH